MSRTPPVLAAGAVCWRELDDGRIEVLLVHRPSHRDVSLPKGKVEPGESLPETAVREVAEETGLDLTLGVPLGTVAYKLPGGRRKEVHYWAAEAHADALARSTFAANDEIERLSWVELERAREELSYAHDVDVVDRFARLAADGSARTFAIIALRHGKALPGDAWDGPDATRPLLQRGRDQSVAVAGGIAAFGPARLVSSTAERCLRTIEPTAERTGLRVTHSRAISQDAYRPNGAGVDKVVAKRLARRVSAVLCSHGPVLPQIVDAVAANGGGRKLGPLRRAKDLSTGEFAVLHLPVAHPESGVLAVEVHGPGA